jgi:SAM-dependent methyltransferase
LVDDGERDLDGWSRALYDTLERSVRIRRNETELREDANPVIAVAARTLFGIADWQSTAERRHRRHGQRRPYDKLYGGVVVEWEWDMRPARRSHGAEQAIDYLDGLREELGRQEVFTAVVCDGKQWGFLAVDPPTGTTDLFHQMDVAPGDRFEWRRNSEAACRRFLELLGTKTASAVTPAGLAAAFGPDGDCAQLLVSLLSEALSSRAPDDRVDTLYREWKRSLDVAYGDLDQVAGKTADLVRTQYKLPQQRPLGEYLFSLHTYFALVARLIAVEVLAISSNERSSRPTNWLALSDDELAQKLEELDAGEIPRGLDIQNLFEGDVFSWFLGVSRSNTDLMGGLRAVISIIDQFAFPRIAFGANPAADVLRDLYQVLVPRPLRRALGEFLTPTWLAEACLDAVSTVTDSLKTGRVLDPCCGTGTFLLPVLRSRVSRLRTSGEKETSHRDVQEVLNDVVGFDINPVAVIAARVNYLVSLGDLAALGPITLPIWRADSIRVPTAPPAQTTGDNPRLLGRRYKEVPTSLPAPFPIPPALATAEGMASLGRFLEAALRRTKEAGCVELAVSLETHVDPRGANPLNLTAAEWRELLDVATELFVQLWNLKRQRRNGVWIRIIENSFAPLFEDRFDVVVGNPPWVTWTRLPEQWRLATQPLWERYGLWKIPSESGGGSRSLASTDVATLVFAVALERYLKPHGIIGLLTPDSLLTGDPGGRAFRRFHLKQEPASEQESVSVPFRIRRVEDWTRIGPFQPDASNRPVFLVAGREEQHEFPVPTIRWERVSPGLRLESSWAKVRLQLRPAKGASNPVDRSVPYSAWSFQAEGAPELIEGGSNNWQFGKGFDTRGANGVYFVRVVVPVDAKGRVRIENIAAAGRDSTVRTTQGFVESALVYPLLRGRDVGHWVASPSGYVLAPYDPDSPAELLTQQSFLRYPEAYAWLSRHRRFLAARKTPPTRQWNMKGDDWCRLDGPIDHMLAGHLVVVRELQNRPAAAVIEPRYNEQLRRTCRPMLDHKLVFCSVSSLDEAVYLAAFINSTPVQDLLASFANQVAVSPQTLARLPVPPFDPEESTDVSALVAAGLAILRSNDPYSEWSAQARGIDDAVLRLLKRDPSEYQPQPRRPSPAKRGKEPTGSMPLF